MTDGTEMPDALEGLVVEAYGKKGLKVPNKRLTTPTSTEEKDERNG